MFGQILYTQVKWTRGALATLSVVAFLTPSALWRFVHEGFFRQYTAFEVMAGFQMLGASLGVIAFFVAFMAVAQPWTVDAAARHVYPLSLPIAWPRYVLMRFGAGAILLLVPTAALLLGSYTVLAMVPLPETLQAYPFTLAFRFLLGSFVAYAMVFGIQYLSGRKAAHLLLGFLVAIAVVSIAAEFTNNGDVLVAAFRWLFNWPGPLGVFGADWMLIDV